MASQQPGKIPVLEGKGLYKSFPGVRALQDVSITCYSGEVLGLVGENGAGKSTLVNILVGVHQPDGGSLFLNGQPLRIRNSHHARSLGIDAVHQELSLLPHLTVGENIMLGAEPVGLLGLIRSGRLHRQAAEVLREISDSIDVNALVAELTPAQAQMVEIAKAWRGGPRVLILDEPTSSLSRAEADNLLALVDRLRSRGTSIIYISHRLEEILKIADRVMVLKDGTHIQTVPARGMTRDQLIRLMVGREMTQIYPPKAVPESVGAPILELKGAGRKNRFADVDLVVRRGEIVGIGGLEGQGQRDLIRAIFGIAPVTTGEVRIGGRPVRISSPAEGIAAGIAFLPDDRKTEGLVLPLSIRENTVLAALRAVSKGGQVIQAREREIVGSYIDQLKVKTPSMDQLVVNLSGGNQQKVILAKWLLTEPQLLILHEPTRGIDIQTKVEIYRLLRELANQGIGVLIVTGDMMELIGLSDRIYVMYEGRVTGELPASEATEERFMTLSSGGQG